jgi:hypothetical protein
MKHLLKTLIILAATNACVAQTAQDNNEILIPVNNLFKGMNMGDSALVHSCFTSSPTIITVAKNKEGVPEMRSGSLQKFLDAVGTPHDQKWNEPIWDVKIQMDGNLAQVWAKYAFYLGKEFSHCGVDAFQLFKGDDGKWRIFHLADTRQKEGCNVPPAIANSIK